MSLVHVRLYIMAYHCFDSSTHLHGDLLLLRFLQEVESALCDVAQVRFEVVHLATQLLVGVCNARAIDFTLRSYTPHTEQRSTANSPADAFSILLVAAIFPSICAMRCSMSCCS